MIRDIKTDDVGRILSLHSYDILDTPEEEPFEHIATLVQKILDVPICAVSFVDSSRQWFKAKRGLDVCETAREISFCTHTIRSCREFIVENAALHPTFRQNPLVTGAPNIRSYLGIPLTTPDGYNLGALCAIDTKSRSFNEYEIEIMQKLAKIVMDELEVRQVATRDALTGCLTRRAWREEAYREWSKAIRYDRPIAIALVDLDNFSSVNDGYGHSAGDGVIRSVAEALRAELCDYDLIGRYGGEEFAVLLLNTSATAGPAICERLRQACEILEIKVQDEISLKITVSIGIYFMANDDSLDTMIHMADKALTIAKRSGRNQYYISSPH